MAHVQNFDNGTQKFNIHLDTGGNLNFKANDIDGTGDTRVVIADDSGEVAIGGSGQFGQIQLKSASNANTVFIGGADEEATVLLGGASGQTGRVRLFDASARMTVDLDGKKGGLALGSEGVEGDVSILNDRGDTGIRMSGNRPSLRLTDTERVTRVDLDGETGRLELQNAGGIVTALLSSTSGGLTLGGQDATDGDLTLLDIEGNSTIECDGGTGLIECVSVFESARVAGSLGSLVPLSRALERILSVRGGRYATQQAARPSPGAGGQREPRQQLGFVAEELEGAFPELVATSVEGRKSINYSRMTVILVEAFKEQQQRLVEQAAALAEAARRIASIEASLAAQAAAQ